VLDKYPKEAKLVFKHFPLPNHMFAREAAIAALAAHDQGKFWEFHSKLADNYNRLNSALIQEIAKTVGLDIEKLRRKMSDPSIERLITRDITEGRHIGIRGVPTVFINGKLLRDRSLLGFQQMIEAELKKKKTP
jgi:protein-disulfide isomerase